MLKKFISRVFIIIASIALLQIFGTIILARQLNKEDMGLYRLILTIAELGSLVSIMGIDHSFVRFFSTPGVSFEKYNWSRFLSRFFLASIVIISLVSLAARIVYGFSLLIISCVFLILVMLTSIFIFTSLLRAIHKYELAIFLSRINFIIFFGGLASLYVFKGISLKNALICYTLSAILANFIVIYYCSKNLSVGKLPIPWGVLKTGLYYFGQGVSILLIIQTGYLLIGKMLTYKDLAVYAVIASVMRLFEFVQDSSYYVLAPHLNKNSGSPLKTVFIKTLFAGLGLALVYLLFARQIIHLLFKGLYDDGAYLVPLFVGAGFIRTLNILPASILGGRGSEYVLRNQFYVMLFAAIFNIFLTYFFIQKWALLGAASASLITWCIVFAASLLVTKRFITI